MKTLDEVEIKLPKQWMHWAQKAGLRKEFGHGKERNCYLIGRGRRWRVNCYGIFECSCPTEYFDRWANSRGAEMIGVPTTEADFLHAVKRLRDESKDKR